MSGSISNNIKKHKKPANEYPKLVKHLAKVSAASFELYQLTKPEALGEVLGIKKQAVQYHIDKLKGKYE